MLLRNFIRSWLTPEYSVPESFEDVHPDLLPSVRSRGYFEMTVLQLRAEGHDPRDQPYRPLADHLAVGLAYDHRVINGHDAVEFLAAFNAAMQRPQEVGL